MIHFARSDVSTRSFDMEVELKASDTPIVFTQIEKDEYVRLFEFAERKNLRIRNPKVAVFTV